MKIKVLKSFVIDSSDEAEGSELDPEKLKEIPSTEIIAKIKREEDLIYENVLIKGDLKLNLLNLSKDENGRNEVKFIIDIKNSIIDGEINFSDSIFQKSVNFVNVRFIKDVRFGVSNFIKNTCMSRFDCDTNFEKSQFRLNVSFAKAQFKGDAKFSRSWINGAADFRGARFQGDAHFEQVQFNLNSLFEGSQFNGISNFSGQFDGEVEFNMVWFNGPTSFGGAQFGGDFVTFRDARFILPEDQEIACRKAKNVLERAENRDEVGYHFYQEMVAIRKRKGFISGHKGDIYDSLKAGNLTILKRLLVYDVLEYILIQRIFGYGVHPRWLFGWWCIFVIAFGLLYWLGNGINGATGLLDYMKISFATAIAPGYIAVIINPGSTGYRLIPEFQVIALAETIVGTFLWAGFIATFAKMYMR